MNGARDFTGSWRQCRGEMKKHWAQLSDCDPLKAEADYDEVPRLFQKRHVKQKKDIEHWAEDWCERGGWRK